MPKIQAFLDLEKSLSKPIKANFDRIYSAYKAKIIRALDAGDIERAKEVAQKLNLNGMSYGLSDHIEYISLQAMLFGASRLAPPKETLLYQRKKKPKAFAEANRQFKRMMRALEKDIKAMAMRAIDELATTVQKSIISPYEQLFDDRVGKNGYALIDYSSSLHTSRLSTLGFCVEAQLAGIVQYQINEMLDSRACPICKRMHGKIFDVDKTYAQVEQALGITDKDQLKQAFPFPKQNKAALDAFKKMNAAELRAAGFAAPPYHPLCRGIIEPVGAVKGAVPEVPPRGYTPQGREINDDDLLDVITEIEKDEAGDLITIKKGVDTAMATIAKQRGFDKLPTAVSSLAAEKGIEVRTQAAIFGEYTAIPGEYGSGIYAGKANGIPVKIAPDAHIITLSELKKKKADYLKRVLQPYQAEIQALEAQGGIKAMNRIMLLENAMAQIKTLAGDLGRLAAMMGYDAISIKRKEWLIINRSILSAEWAG